MLPARTVFYASVIPLVVFYAFFAGALYPASAYLHPHGFYERMAPLVPLGLHGLLKVGRCIAHVPCLAPCHAVSTTPVNAIACCPASVCEGVLLQSRLVA